MLFIINR